MLYINPVQKKDDQKEYCKACGVNFDEDAMCYAAWVDEKLVGVCQFHLSDGKGHITDLRPAEGTDDKDALFIMGRQTMNFINLCGADTAYFEGEIDDLFALRLGFLTDGQGRRSVNLDGFFDEPCKHGKAGSPD